MSEMGANDVTILDYNWGSGNWFLNDCGEGQGYIRGYGNDHACSIWGDGFGVGLGDGTSEWYGAGENYGWGDGTSRNETC